MLTVNNLSARYGRSFKIVRVSFSVAPGELVAILGPNGSGKTSLLRLVVGLDPPRSGSIAWSDVVLSCDRSVLVLPEHRGMSLLFQEGVLFPHLSVRDNVALGLPLDVAADRCDALVDEALSSMRIRDLAKRSTPSLSGGEQQRVALARALVRRPRVMLLDEPFHSLDATVKRPVIAEIRAIAKDKGIATLFVTHDIDEASEMADRVVLLRDGAVVQQGSMADLVGAPVDRWTAMFFGEVESLDADDARSWGIVLPEPVGGSRVSFRPEDLVLVPWSEAAPPQLVVTGIRELGALVEATLALPDGTNLLSRAPAHCQVAAGQPVQARVARVLPPQAGEDAPT